MPNLSQQVVRYYLVLIVCLFAACSTKLAQKKNEPVFYPPAPEPARIQFLTRFSNSLDFQGEQGGLREFVVGKDAGKPIIKPYGISTSKGKLYIVDTILAGLEIVDLATKKFEYFQPEGKGKLRKPINCTTDEAGRLYIADTDRKDVVVFDAQGEYITNIGQGLLQKPTDVSVAGDKIYVSDIKLQKVEVFSRQDSTHQASLPLSELTSEQKLFSPTNIFVKDDQIYVSDFGDFKIKVYTLTGDFIRSVGTYGRALGQFARPKGLAVDPDKNLYVADAGFENVQIFNPEGQLLLFFGGTYKKPGDMWLPAKVHLDYENLEYFQQYVDSAFELKYLIFVSNQYGPDKITVYGFVTPKMLN
jgi:DNA-binding beta-propeller fold protein YncE